MSKRSRSHSFLVYEQKLVKRLNHESDYDGYRHMPRWRQIKRISHMIYGYPQYWHKTARMPKRWKR